MKNEDSIKAREEFARIIREKNIQMYRESRLKKIKKIKSKLYR